MCNPGCFTIVFGTGIAPWLCSGPAESRVAKCHEAIQQLLASTRISTTRSISADSFYPLLSYIDSVPALANLLRDPACVAEAKDAVLRRLEELAYPDPTRAGRLVGLAATPWAAVSVAAYRYQQDVSDRQNRRFRTASDAAKWIAEKHPTIDLDRPYQTKR